MRINLCYSKGIIWHNDGVRATVAVVFFQGSTNTPEKDENIKAFKTFKPFPYAERYTYRKETMRPTSQTSSRCWKKLQITNQSLDTLIFLTILTNTRQCVVFLYIMVTESRKYLDLKLIFQIVILNLHEIIPLIYSCLPRYRALTNSVYSCFDKGCPKKA